MKIFRNTVLLTIVCLITACAPPLPMHSMIPNDVVYSQIQKDFYLKNKIALGEFTPNLPSPLDNGYPNKLFLNARSAAQQALSKANLLAQDTANAKYILSASIEDVANPRCIFGSCENGSSIKYTLINSKTKEIVYSELLIVPFTYEYPAFGANMDVVFQESFGGAVANNFAHLIHVLTKKTKKDFL